MAETKRIVIGSETEDTRKVDLDRLGSKVTVPVSLYDASGNQISSLTNTTGSSVGNGRGVVLISGTATRLSNVSVPCSRIVIASLDTNGNLTNGGLLCVGGSGVLAATANRNGYPIYPANSAEFKVNDLSLLYIDATDNGAIFTYYYEV